MNFTNVENFENSSKGKIKVDKIPQLVTIFGTLFVETNLQLSMLPDFEEKRSLNILISWDRIFKGYPREYFQTFIRFKHFKTLNKKQMIRIPR